MSPKTIRRYVIKFLNSGEAKVENFGRPKNSFVMHPHVEFVIMKAVLQHPERTFLERLHPKFRNRQGQGISDILLYLKRNRFSGKKVCGHCNFP